MTPQQISLIEALRNVRFPPDSQDQKFALAILATAEKNPSFRLSPMQDEFLKDLAVRYRRLLPLGLVMEPKKGYTVLQWMAPELVRSGLIKNEPWVGENATKAIKLFPHKSMHPIATFLAALHPYGYDYIKTAPILALVIGEGKGDRGLTKKDYARLSAAWLSKFKDGAKLRDVMASASIPYALRKISSLVLKSSLLATIKGLATLSHETLSNFIPAPDMQAKWLEIMAVWQQHMQQRFQDRTRALEWAIKVYHPRNLQGLQNDAVRFDASNIADYIGHLVETGRFNTDRQQSWTLQTALRECRVWHEQLARANNEQKFFLENNLRWDEAIDYHPLPMKFNCDDYTFTALQSGQSLFEEGAIMHHCVGSYSKSVIKGTSRIYSMTEIKNSDNRIATVEFGTTKPWQYLNLEQDDAIGNHIQDVKYHLIDGKKYEEGWHLTQAKGPFNARLQTEHLEAIGKLKDRINFQVALWKHCKGDMEKFNHQLRHNTQPVVLAESQLMG